MSGTSGIEPWKFEAAILREFTRRAHHFASDPPPPQDTLEWFALMRHYGAPCRLLDFTYSFYVACYFALKAAINRDGNAAVWAINTDWVIRRFEEIFGEGTMAKRGEDFRFKRPSDFRATFLDPDYPTTFVGVVNPYRLNQRLTAQQGVFLCPGNVGLPFMQNLLTPSAIGARDQVIRMVISPEAKTEAIRELRRMNVTSATLFPDLSGFAESLTDWFHLDFGFTEKDLRAAIAGRTPILEDDPENAAQ